MKYQIIIIIEAGQLQLIPNKSDYLDKLLLNNPSYYIVRNDDGSFKHVQQVKLINNQILNEKQHDKFHQGTTRNFTNYRTIHQKH